ncbi:hypothetical protein VN0211_14620 [Helicobacter pylori]|nr:hypothetical protein VN0211_14620 [Helicobacter pylori]
MMRFVVFDVSGVLEAFDYRGVLIHTQEIKDNLNAKEPENKQQKALLTDFLEVYDKNIKKGFNYLKPRFFLEREKELMEGILK